MSGPVAMGAFVLLIVGGSMLIGWILDRLGS
jgi:hypothetical protein